MSEKEKLNSLTDEELVKELQKRIKKRRVVKLGEYFSNPEIDKYFHEIYRRFKRPIEYYCSKFIFDKDVLSDIFHEIFIKIYPTKY